MYGFLRLSFLQLKPSAKPVTRRCSRCSENFRKTCRKIPVSKSFNKKVIRFLLKKSLRQTCFPVNFAKLFKTSFLQNPSGLLTLLLHTVVTQVHNSLEISDTQSVPFSENQQMKYDVRISQHFNHIKESSDD